MTREIPNKPHPTPNPDGPHAPSTARESTPVPRPLPAGDAARAHSAFDSSFDELNVILDDSIHKPEPDPFLESKPSTNIFASESRKEESEPSFLRDTGTEPRTSELFGDVVLQGTGRAESAAPGQDDPARSVLSSDTPDADAFLDLGTSSTDETSFAGDLLQAVPGSSTDEEDLAGSGFPWLLLLLVSYSSAVTIGLAWLLLAGRLPRSAAPSSRETMPGGVEAVAVQGHPKPAPVPKLPPPLPAQNITDLGRTIRIGNLEVTPVAISLSKVELVRSIDPPDYRREEADSLVLRIRLSNVSRDQAFAPLEAAFLRDQGSSLDRSLITTSSGKLISAYPLAADSEWAIYGQDCPVLEPGGTVETLLASEPGAADRLETEMTWRVRVRIGSYRSDILGIRFTKASVSRPMVDANL